MSTNGVRLSSPRYGLTVSGIGMPGTFAAKIAARVGEGRAANVVPLAIDDHKQALFLRMRDNLSHCRHAGRAELFEKRRLQLHGRHERTHHINHAVAEARVSERPRLVRCFALAEQTRRKLLPTRIEPHDHRASESCDCSSQSIDKTSAQFGHSPTADSMGGTPLSPRRRPWFARNVLTMPFAGRPGFVANDDYRCFPLVEKRVLKSNNAYRNECRLDWARCRF